MTTEIITKPSTSALRTLVMMFSEPGRAFADLERRCSAWLPLLLIVVCTSVLWLWYYQAVDFSWLLDKMTATVADPGAREKAKQFMSKNALMYGSLGGTVVAIPVMFALTALYFLIVAKIMKLEIGFGKWFGFVAWASVPALLSLPLGAMQILLAHNGQLAPGQINPVSLNSLLFHIEMGQRWASLLDSLSLIHFWSWALMVFGFQYWSKSSRATSIFVVLLPYILIYGIWFAKNMMA